MLFVIFPAILSNISPTTFWFSPLFKPATFSHCGFLLNDHVSNHACDLHNSALLTGISPSTSPIQINRTNWKKATSGLMKEHHIAIYVIVPSAGGSWTLACIIQTVMSTKTQQAAVWQQSHTQATDQLERCIQSQTLQANPHSCFWNIFPLPTRNWRWMGKKCRDWWQIRFTRVQKFHSPITNYCCLHTQEWNSLQGNPCTSQSPSINSLSVRQNEHTCAESCQIILK